LEFRFWILHFQIADFGLMIFIADLSPLSNRKSKIPIPKQEIQNPKSPIQN